MSSGGDAVSCFGGGDATVAVVCVARSKTVEGGMREAEAALDNLRDRMRKGERVLPSKVTFGEYAETWFDAQTQIRPRTRESYRWALDRHLLPRFEHRRLSSLTEDDATDLIAAMRAKDYAGSTIRAVLLPLSRGLAHAARRGLVPTNPLDRLERGERPRKSRVEMRCLDRNGIDAADDAAMRTLLALSVSTGLRQGEALGLRWAASTSPRTRSVSAGSSAATASSPRPRPSRRSGT